MKYLWVILLFLVVVCPVGAEEVSDATSVPTEVETGFRFLDLAWADEVTDYRDYRANEEGIFQRGSRAYVYMEIAGYESLWDEDRSQYYTDISIDVELRSRIGLRLFAEEDVVDYVFWDAYAPNSLWFYIWVDIPGWIPRTTYTAQVTIHDRVGEQTLEKYQELSVE